MKPAPSDLDRLATLIAKAHRLIALSRETRQRIQHERAARAAMDMTSLLGEDGDTWIRYGNQTHRRDKSGMPEGVPVWAFKR